MRKATLGFLAAGASLLLLVSQGAGAVTFDSAAFHKTTCPDLVGGVATATSAADKVAGTVSAGAFASSTLPVGVEILPLTGMQTGCGVGYSRAGAYGLGSKLFLGVAAGAHAISATFDFPSAPVATSSFSGPVLPPIALPCNGCPGIALTGTTAIVGVGITSLWFTPGCSTSDIINFLDGDSRIDGGGGPGPLGPGPLDTPGTIVIPGNCAVFNFGGPTRTVATNGGPTPPSTITVPGTMNVPAAGGTVVLQPTLTATAVVQGAGTASASAGATISALSII
jgi:hypothetical protein